MIISYKKLWKKLIDAELKKKDLARLAGISTSQPRALTFRPDGNNSIALQFTTAPKRSFNISVYTTSGQLVHQQNVSSTSDSNCKISIGKELNGVHVVQITSSEEGVTGSELIRFGH